MENDATYSGEASALIKNLTKGKKYKLKVIDFTDKKNQWKTETIEFEAKEKQLSFRISGQSPEGALLRFDPWSPR